jgi:hypothetical protein
MRSPKLTHSLTELQVTASGDSVEREVVYVPLGRSGAKAAIIWKDDLDQLMSLGIGNRWYTNKDQNYVLCFGNRPNKRLMVARLLLNAGPGARVQYKDGNPLNLRRDNLTLVPHNNAKLKNDFIFVPRASA